MQKFKPLSIHVIRDHVLLGGLVAFFLLPQLGVTGSFMFWLGTVFVDVDHYLRFLLVGNWKSLRIKQMFAFFEKSFQTRHHPDFLALDLFHTVEFLLALSLAVIYFAPFFIPVLYGIGFHMIVDFFHLLRHKALTKRAHSIIEYYIRKKRIEARGGSPEVLNAQILKHANLP